MHTAIIESSIVITVLRNGTLWTHKQRKYKIIRCQSFTLLGCLNSTDFNPILAYFGAKYYEILYDLLPRKYVKDRTVFNVGRWEILKLSVYSLSSTYSLKLCPTLTAKWSL